MKWIKRLICRLRGHQWLKHPHKRDYILCRRCGELSYPITSDLFELAMSAYAWADAYPPYSEWERIEFWSRGVKG